MTNGALGLSDFLGLVEAMFQTDARGRLVGSAPHFYLLRTPQNVSADFTLILLMKLYFGSKVSLNESVVGQRSGNMSMATI
jgi:hypothetical protein